MRLLSILVISGVVASAIGQQEQPWKLFTFSGGYNVQVPGEPAATKAVYGSGPRWAASDSQVKYTFGTEGTPDRTQVSDEEWAVSLVDRLTTNSAVAPLQILEFAIGGWPAVQMTIRTADGHMLAARIVRTDLLEVKMFASYVPSKNAPQQQI